MVLAQGSVKTLSPRAWAVRTAFVVPGLMLAWMYATLLLAPAVGTYHDDGVIW